MPPPMTLFTGQWADLPLDVVAEKAAGWGFDGLELACWGDHFEVDKVVSDPGYSETKRAQPARYGPGCWVISNHLAGQAVGDNPIDERRAPGLRHQGQRDVRPVPRHSPARRA